MTKEIEEIGLLEIKWPYNEKNPPIESIITDKHFILPLTKIKSHIWTRNTTLVTTAKLNLQWDWLGSSDVTVVYVYNGMIIVKADFGRDYFKSVIDKMGVLHKLVIQ